MGIKIDWMCGCLGVVVLILKYIIRFYCYQPQPLLIY